MKKRDCLVEIVRQALERERRIFYQGKDRSIFKKLDIWFMSWTCVTI